MRVCVLSNGATWYVGAWCAKPYYHGVIAKQKSRGRVEFRRRDRTVSRLLRLHSPPNILTFTLYSPVGLSTSTLYHTLF